MMLILLASLAFVLAALPAIMFVFNLRNYRPPPEAGERALTRPELSVLIPARDEERSINAAIEAVLASRGVSFELIVLDDHSRDATGAMVADWAARDPRVRLIAGPPLPPGWCGKQHACAVLAEAARTSLLVFLDADVRLAPDGLIRLAAFLAVSRSDLISGIPRQETVTLAEQVVLPLIHWILLGFLPLGRARRVSDPCLGAGCGQLFVARRAAYISAGGHSAIRDSLHDGLKLPRAFRAAGLRTDLCDTTGVATCRMYRGSSELFHGLAKNAGEALAAPALIGPATLVLFGGQVLPFILILLAPIIGLARPVMSLAAAAIILVYLPRMLAVRRFHQSLLGAVLHPLAVLLLLAIQWYALGRRALGRQVRWKGRAYAA